jgi:hypothetical protein
MRRNCWSRTPERADADRREIETYRRFGGDIDAWRRAGGDAGSDMSDADWQLIGDLSRQLAAAATGRASQRFIDALEDRLADCAADGDALALLHELAQQA